MLLPGATSVHVCLTTLPDRQEAVCSGNLLEERSAGQSCLRPPPAPLQRCMQLARPLLLRRWGQPGGSSAAAGGARQPPARGPPPLHDRSRRSRGARPHPPLLPPQRTATPGSEWR